MTAPRTHTTQTLLISDWVADPDAVAHAAAQAVEPTGHPGVAVLVPAWLHGLDWAGDPRASIPCAERYVQSLVAACRARGLSVNHATVGDPHPITAVLDVLMSNDFDRMLLATEPRRIGRPAWLSLERRMSRASGLPVDFVAVAPPRSHRSHHCVGKNMGAAGFEPATARV